MALIDMHARLLREHAARYFALSNSGNQRCRYLDRAVEIAKSWILRTANLVCRCAYLEAKGEAAPQHTQPLLRDYGLRDYGGLRWAQKLRKICYCFVICTLQTGKFQQ